ncbi:MAG: sugar transferase, partial [Anaerolineales bacterium]|nr:sugar transferase [Anaerolineales bacterium]
LHFLLILALERGLAQVGLEQKWRYRLAFLVSASLPVLHAVAQGISQLFSTPLLGSQALHPEVLAIEMAIAGVCAFAGGLFSIGVQQGLWENNSPPPETVQADVYQRHQEAIGEPRPEPPAKRSFDLCLACLGLILSAPVWMTSAFLVWLEDPGPILFVKNSVGKGGINFHQYKFRTMVHGAEQNTGPVLASREDERVLLFGRFLRKTALDELPQLINILTGEMSFVGPRPQRTVLVQDYLRAIPEYAQRHRVLPGLAGLAQVAGDYYLTPRQKLRYDRLYIQHASLKFDIQLLYLACAITFWFRWRRDWNGRLPRALLRCGSPGSKRTT